MSNLSKLKRERMLSFLQKIKEEHKDDDDMLIALGEIESELNAKKYGLVWEQHEEAVNVQMRDNIPVFTEVPEREIAAAPGEKYNFLLEGDNLHSLRLLEKTHTGRIDVIYIDPPYNRGKDDFVYDDNYIDNNDSFRHSKWISFMCERLQIAYKLLAKDGIMFLSIDENEFAQAKLLCDELFGEQSFIECIVWNKRVPKNDKGIGNIHEYILLYEKMPSSGDDKRKFMMPKDGLDEIFDYVEGLKRRDTPIDEAEEMLKTFYNRKGFDRAITLYCQLDKNYEIFGKINMCWPNGNSYGPAYDVIHPVHKSPVQVPSRGWRWTDSTLYSTAGYDVNKKEYSDIEARYDGSVICKGEDKRSGLWFSNKTSVQPSSIKYLRDLDRMLIRSIYSTKSDGSIALESIIEEQNAFSYPKPPKLMYDLLNSALYNRDCALVLDFFAGSGTTGEALLKLNADDDRHHHFILCTNNELSAFQRLKYIHDRGYMQDYNPNKTAKIQAVDSRMRSFFEENPDKYNELFVETQEWKKYGISQHITYPRLDKVISGYQDVSPTPANLKYYRTDFVAKDADDISEELLAHIAEMIQLEHGVKLDGKEYLMVMSDDEADALEQHWTDYPNVKALYVSKNVLLTKAQNALFKNAETHIIPDNYFKFELKEVGEAW